MLKKTIAFFLSVLMTFGSISVVSASANGEILVFGGSLDDIFYSIVETADGNWVAVGSSKSINGDMQGLKKGGGYDAIIVKYDSGGNVLWKKSFGGSYNDHYYSVASAPDGSLVAVGWSDSFDGDMQGLNKGIGDAIIVKYDPNGNVLWKKSFGGSNDYDTFRSVISSPDGNLVAVGWSDSTDGDMQGLSKGGNDAIIVKYNSANGNVLWKKSFGGNSNDSFYSITSTPDGNLVVVGGSGSTNGDMQGLNKGNNDAVIVKYNPNGNVLWKKSFGGSSNDGFASVTTTSDGNMVAVGNSYSTNGDMQGLGLNQGIPDAIIVKYDSSGNVLWKKSFGGSYGDYYYSVASAPDGSLVAVGVSDSTNGDMQGLSKGGYNDAIIVKYDANGNVLWKKSFGGSKVDYYNSVASTPDGNLVAVGSSDSTDGDMQGLNKGSVDAIIVKYDANGNIVPFPDSAPEPASFSANITDLTNQDVIVTINYPEQAVVRQYKIDDGNWLDYTGPVVMTQNGTIYARSQSASGIWSEESSYTVSNIDRIPPDQPTITPNITSPTTGIVVLTISYPADATIKEYKIGQEGNWYSYMEPVPVASNATVYARATDAAGNTSESQYTVNNIITVKPAMPDINVDGNTVTITTTDNPDTVTLYYRANGGSWEEYSGPFTLPAGTYTIEAKAVDENDVESDISSIENVNITEPTNPAGPDDDQGEPPATVPVCDGNTCNILPGMNKIIKNHFVVANKKEQVDVSTLVPKSYNQVASSWK